MKEIISRPSIWLALSALIGSPALQAMPMVDMCVGGELDVPPIISTGDVSLGSDPAINATDCFYADGLTNWQSEEEAVNLTSWAVDPQFWGGTTGPGDADFIFADKSDEVFTDEVLGVVWTVDFVSDGEGKPQTGTWTLSWSDPDPADLPDYFDIILLLKGASAGANGYLFDNLYIPIEPTSESGSYTLNLYNSNPDNGNPWAGLSHSSVLIRAGDTPEEPDPNPVPVPGTIFLFGIGILLMRLVGRHR